MGAPPRAPQRPAPRLLLIEDDRDLGPLIAEGLREEYAVTLVADGAEGLRAAATGDFDAIVADRRLPGIDGLAVVRELRARGVGTPVLLLTALGAVADRVEGLDAGAADYLVKPFDFAELGARLRAMRRTRRDEEEQVVFIGDWEFRPASRLIHSPYEGRKVLTETEAALLALLARHRSRTLSRERILREVFPSGDSVGTVDTYVHYIRRKTERDIITTIRGVGYRLGDLLTAGRAAQDADARAVRAASARMTWQITAVSTVTVLVILAVAVVVVLDQSRPAELLEPPRPGETKIYLDASDALVALALVGALAIAVVAVAGWWISRRAVAPLGRALRVQRAFVADASHELRTPLTVLDTRLQILERKLERQDAYGETLTAARRDARVMIDLVTDLLLVAEESAQPARDAAPDGSDVRPVVLSAVQSLQVLAEDRAVRLSGRVDNEARVALSESSLRRCVVVLVDNALTHSPPGGAVTVTAGVERGRAIVRVADQGTGVAGIDPDRIFDRFARGATAGPGRSFGIGLALVRDLAVRCGGTVQVERTSAAGTTMRLELPTRR